MLFPSVSTGKTSFPGKVVGEGVSVSVGGLGDGVTVAVAGMGEEVTVDGITGVAVGAEEQPATRMRIRISERWCCMMSPIESNVGLKLYTALGGEDCSSPP